MTKLDQFRKEFDISKISDSQNRSKISNLVDLIQWLVTSLVERPKDDDPDPIPKPDGEGIVSPADYIEEINWESIDEQEEIVLRSLIEYGEGLSRQLKVEK